MQSCWECVHVGVKEARVAHVPTVVAGGVCVCVIGTFMCGGLA